MKGISFITDGNNHRKALVIDMKTVEDKYEEVHDFIDVLVAESRRDDELISWDKAKQQLKKKAKL